LADIPVGEMSQTPVELMTVKNTTSAGKSEDVTRVTTRSSADADNRLDAFSGQSRSTNMVPFHM